MLFNVFSDICTFSSHAGHRSRSCVYLEPPSVPECPSVPLLDQCSRDINCITAHYEGEGEVLGGTVPSNYYLHCSALARRCEVCSLARGTLETGIFDPLSRARTVIRAEESSGSRDEGI